jgi:hypothetical protein
MLDASERTAAFLRAAEQLERWAEDLPRWHQGSNEPWWEVLDRRYAAETRIIEQLRRTPQCHMETCPARERVELTLGGFSVSTDDGLAAALRAWARLVRAQLGG